jgi:hypothetical protein
VLSLEKCIFRVRKDSFKDPNKWLFQLVVDVEIGVYRKTVFKNIEGIFTLFKALGPLALLSHHIGHSISLFRR